MLHEAGDPGRPVLLICRSGKRTLDAGAAASVAPIFNTASQVGFGAVIASLAGFALIRDTVLGVAPGNPLISLSIAVNVLAGITGSASGGMSIALQTLGSTYLEMGRAAASRPNCCTGSPPLRPADWTHCHTTAR